MSTEFEKQAALYGAVSQLSDIIKIGTLKQQIKSVVADLARAESRNKRTRENVGAAVSQLFHRQNQQWSRELNQRMHTG